MKTVSGQYKTTRDGGVVYTYEAGWETNGDEVIWGASVRRDGEPAGEPSGTIYDAHRMNLDLEVRQRVEKSIEERKGVA